MCQVLDALVHAKNGGIPEGLSRLLARVDGSALRMVNRLEDAEKYIRQGLAVVEALPIGTPSRIEVLGQAYMELGSVAHRKGKGGT